MILLKIFTYLLSPITVFLCIMIYPLIKIKFYVLSNERIGELVWTVEEFFYHKKVHKKKYITIFISTDKICNQFYMKMIKKKMLIFPGFILFPTYRLIFFLSQYLPFLKKYYFNENEKGFEHIQLNNRIFLNKENINFKLSKKENDIGENFLKNLKISSDDKLVCLHIRDDSYLQLKFPGKDYSYHSYRDSDYKNFIPAINKLCELGYYVLRMGEVTKGDFRIQNKRFIDYSKYYRSDFLDIFLPQRCDYYIGSGAGFDTVPMWVFRKPFLWVNAVPISVPTLNAGNGIYSLKLHFDNKLNKYLNIDEIFKRELDSTYNSSKFINNNILLEENKPEDIKEMALELVNNHKEKTELTTAQIAFGKKMMSLMKINTSQLNYLNKVPIVSNYFIKKYSFLI